MFDQTDPRIVYNPQIDDSRSTYRYSHKAMTKLRFREIHRSTIRHRLGYEYQLSCRGVYSTAIFSGLVGGLLEAWPWMFVCYLLVVIYAINGSVSREKLDVWERVISGWFQYLYLFVVGFLASLSLVKGWGLFVGIPLLLLAPIPLYCYNKMLHFKGCHITVARQYLLEVSKLSANSRKPS